MTDHRIHRRSGYTLIELLISVPLIALLLLGMSSAIYVTSRAMPDNAGNSSARMQAATALNQLAADIAFATSITTRSATSIEVTVRDRTADNVADTVKYEWSGTIGASLQRRLNGSQPEVLVQSVQNFVLLYTAPLDAQSGVPLLKSMDVQLSAPAGSASSVHVTVPAANQPQLP